jgi:hypothetical protein
VGRALGGVGGQLGDVETLAYALTTIGTSYLMAGEIETGVEYLQRA